MFARSLDQPLAPEEAGRKPLQHHPVAGNRAAPGAVEVLRRPLEHEAEEHDGADEGHRVAGEGLQQHLREVRGGEHRQDEEARAHRHAEPRQDEQRERRHDVVPLDAALRRRELVEPAIRRVSGVGPPAVGDHHEENPPREDPQHPPGPVRVGGEERAEGLDRVVRHDGIRGEQEPDDHVDFEQRHGPSGVPLAFRQVPLNLARDEPQAILSPHREQRLASAIEQAEARHAP